MPSSSMALKPPAARHATPLLAALPGLMVMVMHMAAAIFYPAGNASFPASRGSCRLHRWNSSSLTPDIRLPVCNLGPEPCILR